MPELGEVARIVHQLKKNLVGKTLGAVKALEDENIFGKVGTSGSEFQKALAGKKVVDAGQQGKYFWLILSSPPHPVFHFGMTGWWHIRGQETGHYNPNKDHDVSNWPPKFWKFTLDTVGEPKVETAFTDPRRFSRIRLVDCPAAEIRKTTPLKENGPDPVIDRDQITVEWLTKLLRKKHVPVKALLLDQANISGIGNWVGDEIMYHAKLHPEQYSDTFSDAQLKQLHDSILHVTKIAVDTLGDSDQFPQDWLFKHRWGKGKKDHPTHMPNGDKITFLTVGGRTSAVVPSVQKKTGAVAGDVKVEQDDDEVDVKSAKKTKTTGASKKAKVDDDEEVKEEQEAQPNGKKRKASATKPEVKSKKSRTSNVDSTSKTSSKKADETVGSGRRRSARVTSRS